MPKSFLLGGPPPGAKSTARPGLRRSWTGGGVQASRSVLSSSVGSNTASNSQTPARHLPKVPNLPETPLTPPDGYTDETIDDALDDLLRQAAASLKHIDAVYRKLPKPQLQRKHRSGANDFWKPQCRADLWRDDDLLGDSDSQVDSDCSSDGTSVGNIDVEEEGLWDFLRAACNAEPAGTAKRAGARSAFGTPRRASGIGQPFHKPQAKTSAMPKPETKPKPEAIPRENNTYKPAERARAQGFQFGSYGSASRGRQGVRTNCTAVANPEAQVSAELLKAQSEGAEAVKGTLRQLLLKWHPDKAPQGDSAEDTATRAEATRVLRHVLQEKKRLGL